MWKKCEFHKQGLPAEEFRDHVATDGSFVGAAGKSSALQSDKDGELEPMHGTLEAEFD